MNPQLVESNIKNVVGYHLSNCQKLKYKYQSFIFNSILLIFICTLVGGILFYKYKGHSRENRIKREIMKQEYVLSNLRKYQNSKTQNITNLPMM
jgi:hypothetical protein